MPVPKRADAELVAVQWLKSLPELPTEQIATRLPSRSPAVTENGFITAQSVGGAPELYVPMQDSVVQVDTWAPDPSSVPQLPLDLWAAVKAAAGLVTNKWLPLPGRSSVLLRVAIVVRDPRPKATEGFVRYSGDLRLRWTQIGLNG